MILKFKDLTIEQPNLEDIGNVYFKAEGSRKAINKIGEDRALKYMIEPNYEHGNNITRITTMDVLEETNPFNGQCTKCDAITIKRDYLKENHAGIFARSSDCMILSIITDDDIYVLHLSVKSLNSGLLAVLDEIGSLEGALAVEGVCIGKESLAVYGEQRIASDLCNFEKLRIY